MKGECAYFRERKQQRRRNVTVIVSSLERFTTMHAEKKMEPMAVARASTMLNWASRQISGMHNTTGVTGDEIEETNELLLLDTRVDALRRRLDLSTSKIGRFESLQKDDTADSEGHKERGFNWVSIKHQSIGSARVPTRFEQRPVDELRSSLKDGLREHELGNFHAAICLIRNSPTLSNFGVYDRMPYPGSLARRPKIMLPTLCQRMEKFEVNLSIQTHNDLLGEDIERRRWYCKLLNGLDVNAIVDINRKYTWSDQIIDHNHNMYYSMHCYLHGIPPPGTGRYPLSRLSDDLGTIVPLELTDREPPVLIQNAHESSDAAGDARNVRLPPAPLIPFFARRRVLRFLWSIASQIGSAIRDDANAAIAVIDRRVLIATQLISLAFTAAPLMCTLVSRYLSWMPAQPIQQELNELIFETTTPKSLRYLTAGECGVGAVMLLVAWMYLGRWAERYTSRDYMHILSEHATPSPHISHKDVSARVHLQHSRLVMWLFGAWDDLMPMAVQKHLLLPPWSKRSKEEQAHHAALWSGRQDTNYIVSSAAGRAGTMFGDGRDENISTGSDFSLAWKVPIGLIATLWSFCCCTPHFFVNLLTIGTCSLGLGMSISLQVIDQSSNVRSSNGVAIDGAAASAQGGSFWTRLRLLPLFALSILMGQLVGTSGGIMFLAEFVVTSTSLLLGGAITISSNAIKSWCLFFCLSSGSFWTFLFARVALMDAARRRSIDAATKLLWRAVLIVASCWALVLLAGDSLWIRPIDMLIQRDISLDDPNLLQKLQ
ncbi:hypothetical protein MPSEU_000770900 [Mayamaea pseudoterrestris]|nr:hypothetical protein MPSEU_000770900 [Mayamaea pseudoterrestris]